MGLEFPSQASLLSSKCVYPAVYLLSLPGYLTESQTRYVHNSPSLPAHPHQDLCYRLFSPNFPSLSKWYHSPTRYSRPFFSHMIHQDTGQTAALKIGETGKHRESWLTRAEPQVETTTGTRAGEGKPELQLTHYWGLSVDKSES